MTIPGDPPMVFHIELSAALSIGSALGAGITGGFGLAAKILVAYLTSKDAAQTKANESHSKRIEEIVTRFEAWDSANRANDLKTREILLQVSKESVTAIQQVVARMDRDTARDVRRRKASGEIEDQSG